MLRRTVSVTAIYSSVGDDLHIFCGKIRLRPSAFPGAIYFFCAKVEPDCHCGGRSRSAIS